MVHINWEQIVAQAVTVLIGGLVVGLILAWQKESIEMRAVVRQRSRDIHLARSEHLKTLIARLVEERSFGTGIQFFNMEKLSSDASARKEALEELSRITALYNKAQSEANVEAEKYGLLPASTDLDDLHLSTYVNAFQQLKIDPSLDPERRSFSEAWRLIGALIEDLRTLIDHEDELAELALLGRRPPGGERIQLCCLPAFKAYFPKRVVSHKDVDASFMEERLSLEGE